MTEALEARMRKTARVPSNALRKVGSPYQWTHVPGIGERVTLNSGGPSMLVVDIHPHAITMAQDDGTEHRFPIVCIRPA